MGTTPKHVVFVILALSWTQASAADERPNIILCMGDDHGWYETGYNGHPHVKTPVLDEMASTGLRLDRFYAAHPTCSPTRGSVLTGRHPNRYGTFAPGYSIRPEEITIAHLLAKAGYVCGHFGKWHVGPVNTDSPTNPGAMGFHRWLSHDNFFEMDPMLSRDGGPPEKFAGEGSEVIIDETIRFIDQANQNKQSFLAVVWFGSPHEPYSGLPSDLALYDDLPERYARDSVVLTSMRTGHPTSRPLRDVLQERYAEITAMDRAIGKLRRHLARVGLRQTTLLWYCGDNGVPPSGLTAMPLRGLKAQLYEGGIRVPGIIEWPQQIKAGHSSDVNAVTSDMLPTICDLVGISMPDRPLDGLSLKPLIHRQMTERTMPICFWSFVDSRVKERRARPYIEPPLQVGTTPLVKYLHGRRTRTFTNFHHPEITEHDYGGVRVILDDRFKLILDGEPGAKLQAELFDLRSDPGETQNLIESETEAAAKLRQQLRDWQASVLRSLTGADY